jgi:hypothetical protein
MSADIAQTDVETLLGRALVRYELDRYLARVRPAQQHRFDSAAELVEQVVPLRPSEPAPPPRAHRETRVGRRVRVGDRS